MTPEQQRIAIAETCGWAYTKTVNNPDPTPYGRLPKGEHPTMHGKEVAWDLPLPSYLNDLNAMHEAWMAQTTEDRILMHQCLMDIVNRDYPRDKDGCGIKENMPLEMWVILTFEATAAQRAEAFLRTLNLWQNS